MWRSVGLILLGVAGVARCDLVVTAYHQVCCLQDTIPVIPRENELVVDAWRIVLGQLKGGMCLHSFGLVRPSEYVDPTGFEPEWMRLKLYEDQRFKNKFMAAGDGPRKADYYKCARVQLRHPGGILSGEDSGNLPPDPSSGFVVFAYDGDDENYSNFFNPDRRTFTPVDISHLTANKPKVRIETGVVNVHPDTKTFSLSHFAEKDRRTFPHQQSYNEASMERIKELCTGRELALDADGGFVGDANQAERLNGKRSRSHSKRSRSGSRKSRSKRDTTDDSSAGEVFAKQSRELTTAYFLIKAPFAVSGLSVDDIRAHDIAERLINQRHPHFAVCSAKITVTFPDFLEGSSQLFEADKPVFATYQIEPLFQLPGFTRMGEIFGEDAAKTKSNECLSVSLLSVGEDIFDSEDYGSKTFRMVLTHVDMSDHRQIKAKYYPSFSGADLPALIGTALMGNRPVLTKVVDKRRQQRTLGSVFVEAARSRGIFYEKWDGVGAKKEWAAFKAMVKAADEQRKRDTEKLNEKWGTT